MSWKALNYHYYCYYGRGLRSEVVSTTADHPSRLNSESVAHSAVDRSDCQLLYCRVVAVTCLQVKVPCSLAGQPPVRTIISQKVVIVRLCFVVAAVE